ncbi:hypothetical protein Shell_0947 [Staphylothermus hellenicus DSM 12710]|uniref:Uncharacterized protein n=1 Tax=Staphylothermus hellenicus (strain DSM 12710 / JCM 10830 / BK20S6-10-b1 / P8) TaxID=591019 RepID=D7D8F7_STAHD|nr:hypothetical protein Shell_0947 [Staphylothermus hellenicus DSM 12710]
MIRVRENITITVVYGSPEEAVIVNAVSVAASKLLEEGIEANIIQVYMPGTKPSISVNGVYVEIDELLHLKIEEKAYETLIENITNKVSELVSGIAAMTIKENV